MENSRLLNDEQIKGIMGGEAMELKAVIDTAVTYRVEASQEDKAMSDNVMSQDHQAPANNLYKQANEQDICEALFKFGLSMDVTKALAGLLHCVGYSNQQVELLKMSIVFYRHLKTIDRTCHPNVLDRLEPKEFIAHVRDMMDAANLKEYANLYHLQQAVEDKTLTLSKAINRGVDYSILGAPTTHKQSTNTQTIGDVVIKQMMADRARIIAKIRSHMHDDTLEAIDRAIRLTEQSLEFNTLDYHLLDEIKRDIAKGYLPRGVLFAELTQSQPIGIGHLFPGEVLHDLANSVKMTTEADSSPNTENTLSEDNDK